MSSLWNERLEERWNTSGERIYAWLEDKAFRELDCDALSWELYTEYFVSGRVRFLMHCPFTWYLFNVPFDAGSVPCLTHCPFTGEPSKFLYVSRSAPRFTYRPFAGDQRADNFASQPLKPLIHRFPPNRDTDRLRPVSDIIGLSSVLTPTCSQIRYICPQTGQCKRFNKEMIVWSILSHAIAAVTLRQVSGIDGTIRIDERS